MHAILATVGTDGDVFPHIGLASVLRARGHRVTLAGPEPYRDRCLALGLEFCSLVTSEEMEQALADPDMWHPLKSGRMMARWGAPMMGRQYEALANLARGLAQVAESSEQIVPVPLNDAHKPNSVLIANPGLLPARLVQQKLQVPLATLLLQPGLIPSCIAPPEMPGGFTIPRWLPYPLRRAYWLAVGASRLTWRLAATVATSATAKATSSICGQPLPDSRCIRPPSIFAACWLAMSPGFAAGADLTIINGQITAAHETNS